jgi:ABC-type Zn uptake system ZnuABC Zn-binding protein ZnuA
VAAVAKTRSRKGGAAVPLDETDRRLLNLLQGSFPLAERPYAEVARLAELTRHVREEGVQYVLFEHLASPRLADTIARETGADTLVLDPIEGPDGDDYEEDEDYISIQRQNLANLRLALACD